MIFAIILQMLAKRPLRGISSSIYFRDMMNMCQFIVEMNHICELRMKELKERGKEILAVMSLHFTLRNDLCPIYYHKIQK